MLISIVIPVYNVEKYIHKCLESVAKQTYRENLEVIIINDGSPDNSLSIIEAFCEKYSFMECFTIENRGLGGARNFGIEKSHGEYICFLDSDDYLAEDFIEKMYQKAVNDKSDIVICNNYDVFDANTVEYKAIHKYNPTSFKTEKTILFNRVSAWGKLYRRVLFDGLEYTSRDWYEDLRLTPKLYERANIISYVDDALIYYVIREGSIMNNANIKRNLEILKAFDDLTSYFKQINKYEFYQNELEFLLLDHIMVSALTRVILSKDKNRKKIIKQLEDYVNQFSNIYKNPYIKQMPKNRKIILWLNRRRLYFMTKLIFIIKKNSK